MNKKKKKGYYTTPGGYNVYRNPAYYGTKPPDKPDRHCSNCMCWSKLNQWCNELDDPVSSSNANRSYCGKWEWVVPKNLYPGMEGYAEEDKKWAETGAMVKL
jgi:hypothetical protein